MSTALAPNPTSRSVVPIHDLTWAPLASLTLATSPAVDVYASTRGGTPKLLWRHNSRLGDDHLAEMRRYTDQFTFWVAKGDYRRVADAVQSHWSAIAANHALSVYDRFALCEMAYSLELNATLTLMKCGPYVQLAMRMARDLASILLEKPISSRELFFALQYATTPSARSVQIAGYVFQIARLGGEADPATLERQIQGALVHDVGARDILVDIWGTSRRWTDDEREHVERHPQRSYEALLGCGSLDRDQLLMAYQHHERADGSGYPVRILLKETHPWARMLAIADRFQALTTGRTYRQALGLDEALELLTQEAVHHLDAEMAQWWIKSLRSN